MATISDLAFVYSIIIVYAFSFVIVSYLRDFYITTLLEFYALVSFQVLFLFAFHSIIWIFQYIRPVELLSAPPSINIVLRTMVASIILVCTLVILPPALFYFLLFEPLYFAMTLFVIFLGHEIKLYFERRGSDHRDNGEDSGEDYSAHDECTSDDNIERDDDGDDCTYNMWETVKRVYTLVNDDVGDCSYEAWETVKFIYALIILFAALLCFILYDSIYFAALFATVLLVLSGITWADEIHLYLKHSRHHYMLDEDTDEHIIEEDSGGDEANYGNDDESKDGDCSNNTGLNEDSDDLDEDEDDCNEDDESDSNYSEEHIGDDGSDNEDTNDDESSSNDGDIRDDGSGSKNTEDDDDGSSHANNSSDEDSGNDREVPGDGEANGDNDDKDEDHAREDNSNNADDDVNASGHEIVCDNVHNHVDNWDDRSNEDTLYDVGPSDGEASRGLPDVIVACRTGATNDSLEEGWVFLDQETLVESLHPDHQNAN